MLDAVLEDEHRSLGWTRRLVRHIKTVDAGIGIHQHPLNGSGRIGILGVLVFQVAIAFKEDGWNGQLRRIEMAFPCQSMCESELLRCLDGYMRFPIPFEQQSAIGRIGCQDLLDHDTTGCQCGRDGLGKSGDLGNLLQVAFVL